MSDVAALAAEAAAPQPSDCFAQILQWRADGSIKRCVTTNGKVVNWETRDAVQARLRNVVRVVLRKYGYPQTLREQVAEQVLALAKLTDGDSEQ